MTRHSWILTALLAFGLLSTIALAALMFRYSVYPVEDRRKFGLVYVLDRWTGEFYLCEADNTFCVQRIW
jgi:hypothetical protein